MFLGLMRRSEGALDHEAIMKLPWRTTTGYLNILFKETRLEHALKRGYNPAMAEEYAENINEWRKRQSPPG